jgi:hypothetical protein
MNYFVKRRLGKRNLAVAKASANLYHLPVENAFESTALALPKEVPGI